MIKPYEGSEPYIFISYAHRDSAAVFPIIERMTVHGWRVWYDEGIEPGTEWDDNIAAHIEKCDSLIALVSKAYLESDNCRDELKYARDLRKHRILIYLEDVKLPGGIAMREGRNQAVHKYKYTDEEAFYEKLFDVQGLDACLAKPTFPKDHALAAGNHSSATTRPTEEPVNLTGAFSKSLKKGDIIRFGRYPQAGEDAEPEPIEWIVLDVSGGKAILISRYGLDARRYDEGYSSITWEKSTLRQWLNNDFLNKACNDDEYCKLSAVTVSADPNPNHSTDPGRGTRDKVFLLSISEAIRYFATDRDRECLPTKTAAAHNAAVNEVDGTCWWWLRSPGKEDDIAAYVRMDGGLDTDGLYVYSDAPTVRPVIVVQVETETETNI